MTRRTYSRSFSTPDADIIRASLSDLGESLHNAANDLSDNYTLERIDAMLAKLLGAEAAIRYLRRAEIEGSGT